nr:MAG TPA: Golgin subfamily A member 5 [Caudoviricetes sp.]
MIYLIIFHTLLDISLIHYTPQMNLLTHLK